MFLSDFWVYYLIIRESICYMYSSIFLRVVFQFSIQWQLYLRNISVQKCNKIKQIVQDYLDIILCQYNLLYKTIFNSNVTSLYFSLLTTSLSPLEILLCYKLNLHSWHLHGSPFNQSFHRERIVRPISYNQCIYFLFAKGQQ